MSISLEEVFEGAGFDFDDLEDLKKIQSILYEADDLRESVEDKIEDLEDEEDD